MPVMSLRVGEKEIRRLEALARKQNKDRSLVARELLADGWTLSVLRRYRQGKLSLESAARDLDLSVSETIDLLGEFGIPGPLEYDAYLEGLEALQRRGIPRRGSRGQISKGRRS
ncbi:MAG: hypothetical protein HY803_01345 [candidate division NC10 bacterium]|nr:hypothetical protein [candidate division NC10 bacterium]